uniref:Uncharacterized protein n=1 Tax=Rhizophora mucronata TaxID=61149 RepID=A0A2P2Q1J7_RHIMU
MLLILWQALCLMMNYFREGGQLLSVNFKLDWLGR